MAISDKSQYSIEDLYAKFLQFNGIMLEDYDAMEVAGVMIAQALSLYRTCLSEEDYQRMVQSIYNSKDDVRTFE